MRGSAFDRPLRILSRQKSIDQPGCKRIAASHAVENLKIFTVSRLVELAIAITDRAPVILRGGLCFAKRRGHHLEGIFRYGLRNHLLETFHLKCGEILVHAQHHVNVRRNSAVYFLGGFLSAVRFPQRSTVVQIIRHGSAVALRRLHRFQGNLRRGRGESAEYSSRVKPTRSVLAKNIVPIDVSRLQLRNGGVAAVVTAQRCSHAESTLRKIESVARRMAYAVVLHPADQRLIDAALINEILKQPSDRIIRESRNDRGVQAETPFQSASDVVFPAAFAHFKGARRGDAPVTRVESEHDFAQTDDVPAALLLRLNRQTHPSTSTCFILGNSCILDFIFSISRFMPAALHPVRRGPASERGYE